MEIREPVGDGYSCHLHANEEAWKVMFEFPGPDRRYNPTYVTIWPNEVVHLCAALSDLCQKYETLKPIVRGGAEVTDSFGHVSIRVGGQFDGVYIGHHLRFTDRKSVNEFITAIENVGARGEELVQGLRLAAQAGAGSQPSETAATAPATKIV